MCGIVGAIAHRNVSNILITGLKRLEYRGYDSAGVALLNDQGLLGGLGSLPGAILGALVIGVGEMAATAYIGAAWPVAVQFLVIIVVLITRPQGILGTRLREDAVA